MIDYDARPLQLGTVIKWRGSVFPKAAPFGLVAGILSAVFHHMESDYDYDFSVLRESTAYSAFAFVLGFLLVFRTSQAYTRFWEGTTLMQLLRGQWVGAFSSILAFSVMSQRPKEQLEDFRQKLIRLFSLLHASALQYVGTMALEDEQFNVIGAAGLDEKSKRFIEAADEDTKIYVVIQWIQQLILMNLDSGILPVPPPIVSRVFQDLSTGIVTLNNARKISDTPFPFPYAQMVTVILLIHLGITPVFIATWTTHWIWAGVFAFVSVFTMWSINFIAAEIEQPFGGDVNDIDIKDMQYVFNRCLVAILSPEVTHAPALCSHPEARHTFEDLQTMVEQDTGGRDPNRHLHRSATENGGAAGTTSSMRANAGLSDDLREKFSSLASCAQTWLANDATPGVATPAEGVTSLPPPARQSGADAPEDLEADLESGPRKRGPDLAGQSSGTNELRPSPKSCSATGGGSGNEPSGQAGMTSALRTLVNEGHSVQRQQQQLQQQPQAGGTRTAPGGADCLAVSSEGPAGRAYGAVGSAPLVEWCQTNHLVVAQL